MQIEPFLATELGLWVGELDSVTRQIEVPQRIESSGSVKELGQVRQVQAREREIAATDSAKHPSTNARTLVQTQVQRLHASPTSEHACPHDTNIVRASFECF